MDLRLGGSSGGSENMSFSCFFLCVFFFFFLGEGVMTEGRRSKESLRDLSRPKETEVGRFRGLRAWFSPREPPSLSGY